MYACFIWSVTYIRSLIWCKSGVVYTLINVRFTRAEKYSSSNATIFDNLFHYKNILTVQWIKRLKLCMVTMATLPPAKELKIQVVSWQNEIRTLDVLKSPTCHELEVNF